MLYYVLSDAPFIHAVIPQNSLAMRKPFERCWRTLQLVTFPARTPEEKTVFEVSRIGKTKYEKLSLIQNPAGDVRKTSERAWRLFQLITYLKEA